MHLHHCTNPLPLTLTLSPGEREQLSDVLLNVEGFHATSASSYLPENLRPIQTLRKHSHQPTIPLSPRERAGVRGNRSPNNLTLANALESLHEPASPLPQGEGTALGRSPKCRRIPCYLRIQLFARKPPPIQPPRKHSHRPTIPPLPKGEGRGEGEQDSRALFHYERLLQEVLCTTSPPGIREKTSRLSNPIGVVITPPSAASETPPEPGSPGRDCSKYPSARPLTRSSAWQ